MMNMNVGYCRDCQFWANVRDDGWGYCDKASAVGGRPSHDDTKAITVGSVIYPEGPIESDLMTAPDFGCVMFQAKTKEDAKEPA